MQLPLPKAAKRLACPAVSVCMQYWWTQPELDSKSAQGTEQATWFTNSFTVKSNEVLRLFDRDFSRGILVFASVQRKDLFHFSFN